MSDWQEFKGEFNVYGKPFQIQIYHDLPGVPGLNIEGAFTNWLYRTNEHTSASLADYINSKSHMTGNKAYTIIQWEAMKKDAEDLTRDSEIESRENESIDGG